VHSYLWYVSVHDGNIPEVRMHSYYRTSQRSEHGPHITPLKGNTQKENNHGPTYIVIRIGPLNDCFTNTTNLMLQ